MTDRSKLFLLFDKIPQVLFVVFFVIAFHQGMEKIEIEIAGAGALEAGLKFLLCGFFGRGHAGMKFCRECIAFPGISLDKRFPDGIF